MREKLNVVIFDKGPIGASSTGDNGYVGFVLSTAEKMSVNKTQDVYHINYIIDEFIKINPLRFVKVLSSLFEKNMPGKVFNLRILNYSDTPIDGNKLQQMFRGINNIFLDADDSIFVNDDDPDDDLDNDIDDESDESDEEYGFFNYPNIDDDLDDEEIDDAIDTVNRILGITKYSFKDSIFGNYEDDESSDDEYRPRKSYPSSRILKEAKHAKRDIKRHGIIIISGEARKKDEKIIKQFLKDFIPGNSDWIKSYRKRVLKRWLNQYSITKKTAKKLARMKEGTKTANNRKKVTITTEDVSNATRNILKRYNPFYDTSK